MHNLSTKVSRSGDVNTENNVDEIYSSGVYLDVISCMKTSCNHIVQIAVILTVKYCTSAATYRISLRICTSLQRAGNVMCPKFAILGEGASTPPPNTWFFAPTSVLSV